MTSPGASAGRPWTSTAVALVTAFAARAAAGFALNTNPTGPRGFDFYGFMADNALSGRGLGWDFYTGLGWKAANRAPLYPLFLAGVRGVFGTPATAATIVAQAALGALGCLVPAMLARRWGGDRAARVALWIAALWPYSLLVDTGLVEHVVFTPLALLTAFAVLRAEDTATTRAGFAAGVLGGLAALARITFVPSVALLGGLLLVRRGIRPAAALALGAATVLSLYAARNHSVTGSFVLGTDGGRALWVGNAPETFRHYPAGSIDESEREMLLGMEPSALKALQGMGEIEQDRKFSELASANVSAHPGAVAWGGLRKVGALWSPIYNPAPVPPEKQRPDRPLDSHASAVRRTTSVVRYAVHGTTFVLLVAGALAAVAAVPRVRPDLPVLLLLLLSFGVVAAAFWGQPRYLAPLHGIGIALVAAHLSMRGSGAGRTPERAPA